MRNLFQQIVLHNICKANQIQYNTYFIGPGEYKAAFERIDLNEILKKQNLVSRYSQAGFIWVLCTCVFFIAEYHFSLIIDS